MPYLSALEVRSRRGAIQIHVSINKFISRHSTEACATVRLCRIKEKYLETDLKCVNGWNSSTVSGIYVYLTLPYYHCDYHSVFTQNNKI